MNLRAVIPRNLISFILLYTAQQEKNVSSFHGSHEFVNSYTTEFGCVHFVVQRTEEKCFVFWWHPFITGSLNKRLIEGGLSIVRLQQRMTDYFCLLLRCLAAERRKKKKESGFYHTNNKLLVLEELVILISLKKKRSIK